MNNFKFDLKIYNFGNFLSKEKDINKNINKQD